jgi:hypothetical protein
VAHEGHRFSRRDGAGNDRRGRALSGAGGGQSRRARAGAGAACADRRIVSRGDDVDPGRLVSDGLEERRAPGPPGDPGGVLHGPHGGDGEGYRECWSASACSQPIRVPADESESQLAGCNWEDDQQEHPINCVTFEQAVSFCLFVDGRLPTEAEWEFAARGTDGRIFPWGNKAPGKKQLLWEPTHKDHGTFPVGSFPAGASPFGLLDMAGNVHELTADWFGEYQTGAATDPKGPASGDAHPARGGGWATSGASNVHATHRVRFPAATRRDDLGFRCVRAAQDAAAAPSPK